MITAMAMENGKMELIDKVLDKALTTDKARRYYLAYRSILAKYYEHLKDLDLTSLVQKSVDLIDSSLTFKENREILENFFRGQALGIADYNVDYYEDKDPFLEVLDSIERAKSELRIIEHEYKELVKMREQILAKMNELVYRRGHIERKWVKNKVGKRYYYYYLRYYEGNRRRSVYLGKEIPQSVRVQIRNWKELQTLYKKLREIEAKIQRIERAMEKIERVFSEIWA